LGGTGAGARDARGRGDRRLAGVHARPEALHELAGEPLPLGAARRSLARQLAESRRLGVERLRQGLWHARGRPFGRADGDRLLAAALRLRVGGGDGQEQRGRDEEEEGRASHGRAKVGPPRPDTLFRSA
jgi:hypothetical protein